MRLSYPRPTACGASRSFGAAPAPPETITPSMRPLLRASGRILRIAMAIAALAAAPGARAQESPPQQRDSTAKPGGWPPGVQIEFLHSSTSEETGDVLVEGAVTVTWKSGRFQCDRAVFHQKRYVEADGNVLLEWGGNRISGTHMEYDLETERGVILDAVGQVEGDYLFTAKRVEKIGDDLLHLDSARVTTCTQPTPYWSFRVSSAKVRINGYARMWNPRLKIAHVPVFYLPWLLWPVKEGRAPGLLLPELHTTQNRGRVVSLPLFVPLGRSADMTIVGSNYTKAGFGTGLEVRAIPNRNGVATFKGFYINDKVSGSKRYSAGYQQTQKFLNGFQMFADINVVSDFNYYSDYERELKLTSTPSTLARLELSRNGRWTSLNVRELRREQLLSDGSSLVQQTFPEIELRGRSRKLGDTPLFLSYEASLASIQQNGRQQGSFIDADYERLDLWPTLSMPLSRLPWLDVNPHVSYRTTYYTQSQTAPDPVTGERSILDRDIARSVYNAGIDITGPKFYRIFETPRSSFSKKYKNNIEPTISYNYAQAFDRLDDIILYDEIDRYGAAGNAVTYGLSSRLFAQRPQRAPQAYEGAGESILMPGGETSAAPPGPELAPEDHAEDVGAPPGPEKVETVEIATVQIMQTRSFDRDLSRADLNGDGVEEATSRASDVQFLGRFNPSPKVSVDLRANYQVLYKAIRDVTLSGTASSDLGRLRLSLVFRNGLGVQPQTTIVDGSPVTAYVPRLDDTQVSFATGLNLFGGRLRLDLNGTYDANPGPGQSRFPEKQWRIQYSTQCCTIRLERLARGFSDIQNRSDYYLRVDLRGVGKILDQAF